METEKPSEKSADRISVDIELDNWCYWARLRGMEETSKPSYAQWFWERWDAYARNV